MPSADEVLDLLRRAPRPPEDGPDLPAGATVDAIESFEQRTGLSLTDEHRAWLATCDGVMAGPGGLYGIDPHHDSLRIEDQLRSWPMLHEAGWIPLAGDGCGDVYAVVSEPGAADRGTVVFVDAAEPTEPVPRSPSVWTFLVELLRTVLGET